MGHVVEDDSHAANGVDGSDTVEIPCITIAQLLAKHNITHVDMLSIDIEGAEYDALSPLQTPSGRDIEIDVVTMEVFWSDINLRWLMSDMGFWKVTDIAHVDDIFVRVQFMDHPTVSSRDNYYKMMQNSQQQRQRPIIAPWYLLQANQDGRCQELKKDACNYDGNNRLVGKYRSMTAKQGQAAKYAAPHHESALVDTCISIYVVIFFFKKAHLLSKTLSG